MWWINVCLAQNKKTMNSLIQHARAANDKCDKIQFWYEYLIIYDDGLLKHIVTCKATHNCFIFVMLCGFYLFIVLYFINMLVVFAGWNKIIKYEIGYVSNGWKSWNNFYLKKKLAFDILIQVKKVETILIS